MKSPKKNLLAQNVQLVPAIIAVTLVSLLSVGTSLAYLGSIEKLKTSNAVLDVATGDYSRYLVAKAAAEAHEAAKQSIPAGYSDFQDSGVAYKWARGYCNTYTRCIYVKLYAYESCPGGVYVEGNFTHNGSIVDYGNATVGSMSAGDTAKVRLQSYNDNADQTDLTEINCH